MTTFIDEFVRSISKYKEYDARLRVLLKEIESNVDQTSITAEALASASESLQAIEELNTEKLNSTLEFNEYISEKIKEFKKYNEIQKRAESASATDSATENHEENHTIASSNPLPTKTDPAPKNKRKRGRKPKRVLTEIKLEDLNKVGSDHLMMLADAALRKEGKLPPETHSASMLKVPVTKRAGKRQRFMTVIGKMKKGGKTKKREKKDEIEQQNIASGTESNKETPDDEPTYCLCNKVSFGQMIECDNEACFIEWFHFSCVQLKRAPKGKW